MRKPTLFTTLFAVLFALLFAAPVTAAAAEAAVRTITVTGAGSVKAEPDMARVSVGVTTEAKKATDAVDRNSRAMAGLFAVLGAMGVGERDRRTSAFTLFAQRGRSEPGRPQPAPIVGFSASNQLIITVRALDALGAILDALVSAGATNLGGISFAVSNRDALVEEARLMAIADARARARRYAAAAGAALGPVISIRLPGATQPGFLQQRFALESADVSAVPIAPGESEITATIEIVFALQ